MTPSPFATSRIAVTATLALLALAACNSAADSDAPPPPPADQVVAPAAPEPKLAIEGEGLRLFNAETGSARPIAFGTPKAQVIAALAFRGAPALGTNEECGAGPLGYANWPDGLGLLFDGDKFAGWSLDGRDEGADKLTTASGVGIGSTRAEVADSLAITVEESTLGTEFAADDLGGLFDGKGSDAKVTNLWAGVTCVFR